MSNTEREVSLSKSDLAELIATAIAAAKAPNVVEQKKLDEDNRRLEGEQEARKLTSQGVLADIKGKRDIQRICSHEHKNGDSHCVLVQSGKDTYILCQKNQCKIRPGTQPASYGGNDIYDTALFNKLMQKLPTNELFQ
jgi:hypothetical protein